MLLLARQLVSLRQEIVAFRSGYDAVLTTRAQWEDDVFQVKGADEHRHQIVEGRVVVVECS